MLGSHRKFFSANSDDQAVYDIAFPTVTKRKQANTRVRLPVAVVFSFVFFCKKTGAKSPRATSRRGGGSHCFFFALVVDWSRAACFFGPQLEKRWSGKPVALLTPLFLLICLPFSFPAATTRRGEPESAPASCSTRASERLETL